MAVVISDISIKNQVATLIAHIHVSNNLVIKTLHYIVNVTSIRAELFAIRCNNINQATQIDDIYCIIIITDSLHVTKNFLIH